MTRIELKLQEHRDLLQSVLADALEDVGMTDAIRKGRRTETATRDAALRALEVRE